ncbi:MAG: MmgE/PrpD family protein, partial [Proteobacteria bacterium]|nr:MmgE/PrpD family protein [Pseudomonadota bacterium]
MTADSGLTSALAARIRATQWNTLSSAAQTVAKQCMLDFVGVALAGAREPLVEMLNAEAEDAGGHAQAALIGRGRRASVEQAALINGAAGHAHDYDDVHLAMNGHPTVPVAPAVLALAEHLDKGAPALLAAFAAGVDTECIIGRYLGSSHYAQGWHATGTLGSFGAAAAAANLLQLDHDATARALGIAGTQAAGLKSQFGTMCKPLHAGHAAATGVQAARLAARGFTSRTDILEVPQGFAATQGDGASAERFNRALLEDSYLPGVCFKYHAACYMTHSSIEAIRGLLSTHRIAPNDVTSVELTVNEGHFGICNIAAPRSGLEAKFSLRFTAAMALRGRDTSGIETYTDQLTREPELVALRDKVQVVAWPDARPETRVRIHVGA